MVRSDPRRALCVPAALAAPTYIRPGSTRSKIPHAHCEGAGSKGDGTFLLRGRDPCRSHRHVGCHRTVGIEQRIQHQFARAPRLTIGSSLSWCTGCGCSGGVAHVGPSNKCSPRAKWRAHVRLTMLPGSTSPENLIGSFSPDSCLTDEVLVTAGMRHNRTS